MNRIALSVSAVALLVASAATAQTVQVDAGIPGYQRTSGVSGNLNSIGSDTLNNLMTLWAEGFRQQYPNVKIQIEGKGSSTAPPALISGTAQMGPMSREMKAEEIDAFEKKYGYKPVAIRVAVDALAVYVNKDNPLEKLSMAQVDAIFSKTRKGGGKKDLKTWGDLGLGGDFASRPMSLYGRNSASGTYGYFKEFALFKGDYKDSVKEQPGSASVVQGVTEDDFGIGYSGIGYKTSGVKAVALSAKDGGTAYGTDDVAHIYDGSYPLSRFLYVYINKTPGKPLDPMVREFVKYILAKEGQQVVVKDGYLPVTAAVAAAELAKLN